VPHAGHIQVNATQAGESRPPASANPITYRGARLALGLAAHRQSDAGSCAAGDPTAWAWTAAMSHEPERLLILWALLRLLGYVVTGATWILLAAVVLLVATA
jgi:hypothetical protein